MLALLRDDEAIGCNGCWREVAVGPLRRCEDTVTRGTQTTYVPIAPLPTSLVAIEDRCSANISDTTNTTAIESRDAPLPVPAGWLLRLLVAEYCSSTAAESAACCALEAALNVADAHDFPDRAPGSIANVVTALEPSQPVERRATTDWTLRTLDLSIHYVSSVIMSVVVRDFIPLLVNCHIVNVSGMGLTFTPTVLRQLIESLKMHPTVRSLDIRGTLVELPDTKLLLKLVANDNHRITELHFASELDPPPSLEERRARRAQLSAPQRYWQGTPSVDRAIRQALLDNAEIMRLQTKPPWFPPKGVDNDRLAKLVRSKALEVFAQANLITSTAMPPQIL